MPDSSVTVVVAAKNEELHLEEALRSILLQQGVDLEVIVVDDSSDDGTADIARRLAHEDHRLRLIHNPGRGKCAAFNTGVAAARGRFTCIFAGDDVMPPGSLAARYQVLADADDSCPVVGLSKLVTMSENKRFDGHVIPRGRNRGNLSGVSPLMNRAALALMFPVPEELPNEDTWMQLAVLYLANFRVIHSGIICCHFRVHSGNSINLMMSFDRYNERYTARMRALSLFLSQHSAHMDSASQQALAARAECESYRADGKILGILSSPVGLVEKMRALSMSNRVLFAVRKRAYGLLSGW